MDSNFHLIQINKFIKKYKSKKELNSFIEKVLIKYDSISYLNRYKNKNQKPTFDLLFFIADVADVINVDCSTRDWDKLVTEDTYDMKMLGSYIIHTLHQHGDYLIKIIKK